MTVRELVMAERLEIIAGDGGLDNTIAGGFAGDLLSLAMSAIKSGDIWITVQTNVNVLAVAVLTEAACVLVAESMNIEPATISKANSENIPLLRSGKGVFELVSAINEMLL